MSRGRRANPAVIGAFVLGAIALATTVVLVWGSGRFFRRTQEFVCYFDGSINGLNLGAPVKFRGVEIGAVKDIRFRMSDSSGVMPAEIKIPIWFDIDLERLEQFRGQRIELSRARVDALIAQGLRAQLQTESFVTGVLYIALDYFPDSPVVLVHQGPPGVPEIPTQPTTLQQASQAFGKVIARIEKLDIEALVNSVQQAVDGVNGFVRSPELEATVGAAHEALVSIRRLSQGLEPEAGPTVKSLRATSTDAQASLKQLDATLVRLQSLLDPQAPLAVDLSNALVDLGEAARSVRDLADYLDRKPNAILTGRPGS